MFSPSRQVAERLNPDAKVVYVDHDPMVVAHANTLLADSRSAIVIEADLRDPDYILSRTELRSFLDFKRPVALLLVGMIIRSATSSARTTSSRRSWPRCSRAATCC